MTLDPAPSIPTELVVVGEDRNDPRHLLLLGDDGVFCWTMTPSRWSRTSAGG